MTAAQPHILVRQLIVNKWVPNTRARAEIELSSKLEIAKKKFNNAPTGCSAHQQIEPGPSKVAQLFNSKLINNYTLFKLIASKQQLTNLATMYIGMQKRTIDMQIHMLFLSSPYANNGAKTTAITRTKSRVTPIGLMPKSNILGQS